MKKTLIIIGAVVGVLAAITIWLASSVGPETAPDELKTRAVPIDNA